MRIESKDVIGAPLETVFKLVRDELPALVQYLPNVSRIEVKERAPMPEGDRLRIVNRWYARGEVPSIAKKFISPDILSWEDTAVWNERERFVEYTLKSFVANDLFSVRGRNSFKDVGEGRTELLVACDLDIYPERLPGVPRFLASTIKQPVEEFIARFLKPNLSDLASGLNRYFAEKKS